MVGNCYGYEFTLMGVLVMIGNENQHIFQLA